MTEPAKSPPRPDPDEIDAKMAEILAGDERSISQARRRLRESDEPGAGDLLSRLDALDFVDSVVGGPGSSLPERLGEYRITDLLGRGGMGTVFEAFQESLERVVALKVLSPSLTTDSGMRRRFRAEARANATLHHQHIVPVYGFGESAGHLYFTMEKVDGVSLDKHIAAVRAGESSLSDPRQIARQFAGVADALGHAHRRGILHRDVKPGNVLVHPDGSYALADFGLSKMLGTQSLSLSADRGFLGTLQYAAPEQARGRDFCPASDLYSLGVTMFETLTGELPLAGKTTEAILDAVLHAEPERLRSKLPKVPRDLDAVMCNLLSKEPDERYQDGEVLARDLLRVADDEPIRIRRLSPVVRLWRRVRKHPALSGTIAVAAILLGALLVLGKVQRDDSKRNRYEQLLRDAAVLVERQPGDPAGPDGLFAALTGYQVLGGDDPMRSAFLELLDRAAGLGADDGRPSLLRDAFGADPAPDATRSLSVGEGVAARQVLTRAIDQLEGDSGLSTRDAPTLLRLYRLYLGRAVASLTTAVSDPSAASKDLIKASMLRRRAFFPRMLTTILDWNADGGVEALEPQIEALLEGGPAGGGHVIGVFLITLARLNASRDSNLFELELDFGARRRLDTLGSRLLDVDAAPIRASISATDPVRRPRTVEARIRRHARNALNASSTDRAAYIKYGEDLLDAKIASDSPLAAWTVVLDLIQNDANVRGLDPSFDSVIARRQVRGLTEYLRLEPPGRAVRTLWPRARQVLDALPNSHSLAASRLRAMFAARSDVVEGSIEAADAWVSADANDPEAYFCRMRCWATRDAEKAATDAVQAIRRAVDEVAMRARVSAILAEAAKSNPDLIPMLQHFRVGS